MRPRAIQRLAGGLSDHEFLRQIAVGLGLIAEHVGELESAVGTLEASSQWRGTEAIRVVAEEEAAKFLILLDAVRCDPRKQAQKSAQLARFNQHLVKGIYAKVCNMRPATFGELLGHIRQMRLSHYLDGPNDVDWVFRNEIEARREERLYVDFVETDDGPLWLSPESNDIVTSSFVIPGIGSSVSRLVAALARAGLTKLEGLQAVGQVWRGWEPNPETPWSEVSDRNYSTLEYIYQAGVLTDEFSEQDGQLVIDTWSYPLHAADLTQIEVDIEILRDEQRNWNPGI